MLLCALTYLCFFDLQLYFLLLLLLHHQLLLLLLLLYLLLPQPTEELVRVGHQLWDEVMFVVVLQVIDFLVHLVVRVGGLFDV